MRERYLQGAVCWYSMQLELGEISRVKRRWALQNVWLERLLCPATSTTSIPRQSRSSAPNPIPPDSTSSHDTPSTHLLVSKFTKTQPPQSPGPSPRCCPAAQRCAPPGKSPWAPRAGRTARCVRAQCVGTVSRSLQLLIILIMGVDA